MGGVLGAISYIQIGRGKEVNFCPLSKSQLHLLKNTESLQAGLIQTTGLNLLYIIIFILIVMGLLSIIVIRSTRNESQ